MHDRRHSFAVPPDFFANTIEQMPAASLFELCRRPRVAQAAPPLASGLTVARATQSFNAQKDRKSAEAVDQPVRKTLAKWHIAQTSNRHVGRMPLANIGP